MEKKCTGNVEVIKEIPGDQAEIVIKLRKLEACTNPDEWAEALNSFEERFDMESTMQPSHLTKKRS